MNNTLRIMILSLLFSFLPYEAFSQENIYDGYVPGSFRSIQLVRRLSYENFKNIRALKTSIINYGGGQEEFDKLVDQYSEASAQFYRNNIEKSAELFTANEKEIFISGKKLLPQYRKDAEEFLMKAMKFNIKNNVDLALEGKKPSETVQKYLYMSAGAIRKAEDYYQSYKYVLDSEYSNENKTPSATIISSMIYYYRKTKESFINMYRVYVDLMTLDKDEKKDREEKDKLFEKILKENFREGYKKDMADNGNKIYVEEEKNKN